MSAFKTPSVCGFKMSPCMLAHHAHMLHAGVVPVHTETFLNLHTEVLSACHGTHHDNDNDNNNNDTNQPICGLIRLNTRKFTRSRRGKDSQIDTSFFVFSVVVHGRSLLI